VKTLETGTEEYRGAGLHLPPLWQLVMPGNELGGRGLRQTSLRPHVIFGAAVQQHTCLHRMLL